MFNTHRNRHGLWCLSPIAFITAIIVCTGMPALAHNITFTTDFANPDAGPGTILSQSTVNAARIFQYTEDEVFATAIQDVDAESHFHLFGDGLLVGGDSEGIRFTFGGADPTVPFNVEQLEVLELGTRETFFIPFMGPTPGSPVSVSSTGILSFDEHAWSGISHFIATFDTPLAGDNARLRFTNLDLHPADTAPVPEPSTLGLFALGLTTLGLLRYRARRHRTPVA